MNVFLSIKMKTLLCSGVLYQKVTDKEGIASLNITLLAGEYIITSYWNDFQVGNTIKID